MGNITNFLNNVFTARDGVSYSLTKLVGIGAAVALTYQFLHTASQDYLGYGAAMSTIMAALAAKYYVEGTETK